jgi:hypothetical protein
MAKLAAWQLKYSGLAALSDLSNKNPVLTAVFHKFATISPLVLATNFKMRALLVMNQK